MTEKTDIRIERTQKTIKDAFIKLLKTNKYESIYVKDISNLAMINRKTFYVYYDNKDILYDEIISEIFEILCSTLIYTKNKPDKILNKDILFNDVHKLLMTLDSHREDLYYLLNPTLHHLWFPILESTIIMKKKHLFLKVPNEENKKDIPFKLYIDTISSLFVIWIYWWLSEENYSSEEAADILCRMMSKNMTNIFRYNLPLDK